MIDPKFVLLSIPITLYACGVYIRDIFRGKVKPNKMTWALWTLAPMIAFAAQISEGAGLRSVQTFSAGFGPLMVVVASYFSKKSYWKLQKSDYFFGVLSLLGLLLWFITGKGVLAIVFSILADLFAAIPTVQKIYKHPETENGTVFGFGIVASVITMLTVTNWRFEEYGFSLYILLICAVMYDPTAKVWAKGAKK